MNDDLFRITQVSSTASTNDDLKLAADKGAPEGLVIQALRQTAGKGRQGRAWDSPEGNLYASILLRPDCSPHHAGLYTFVASLAVADTVRSYLTAKPIQLKWPNDVLIEGKKICGILLETNLDSKGLVEWLVIGVGINVRHHPNKALYPTTSLLAEGANASVDDVLATLLNKLAKWRGALEADGFEPVRQAWLKQAKTGALVARLPHTTLEGEFAGLDEHGSLILRLADGAERSIAAGDVFFQTRE